MANGNIFQPQAGNIFAQPTTAPNVNLLAQSAQGTPFAPLLQGLLGAQSIQEQRQAAQNVGLQKAATMDAATKAAAAEAQAKVDAATLKHQRDLEIKGLDGGKPSTTLTKLQAARDKANAAGNARVVAEIQKRIDKELTVTGTTEFDRPDKTRNRDLLKQRGANTKVKDLSSRLRGLLQNPDGSFNQDVIGAVAGTKQLLAGGKAQLDALRSTFVQDASTVEAKEGQAFTPSKFFNPAIGQAELLKNMLAYAVAKSNDDSGRLSDADVQNAKDSLGASGAFTNAADIIARLDVVDDIASNRLGAIELERNPSAFEQLPQGAALGNGIHVDANGNKIMVIDGKFKEIQ